MTDRETMEKGAGRESFLDILRIAATCAVVLLHTVTGVRDTADMSLYPLEEKVFLAILDLVTWCVPVFLMISGYLFLRPDRKLSYKKMLGKYCRRILFALFLFGVPYACLELIATEGGFRAAMIPRAFFMVCAGESWSHLWYLYLILALYLVTPPLKYLLERCPGWLFYSVLAVFAVCGSLVPFAEKLANTYYPLALPDSGIYLFYYLCGYAFAKGGRSAGKPRPGGRRGKRFYAVLAATVVLLAGMVLSRLSGGYPVQMAYNYPFTVLLTLALFYLARELMSGADAQKGDAGGSRADVRRRLGSLCFAVYLVHPIFVNIAYKLLHVTPLDFAIAWSLPLFFAGILGLSFLLAAMLYRIPWLSGYVL